MSSLESGRPREDCCTLVFLTVLFVVLDLICLGIATVALLMITGVGMFGYTNPGQAAIMAFLSIPAVVIISLVLLGLGCKNQCCNGYCSRNNGGENMMLLANV